MLSVLLELVRELWLPYAILILLSFVYIKQSAVNYFISREKSLSCKNVLFVIAHPDDECMFFAPTILSLLDEGHKVFVVCLSKGDYEGFGDIRKKELIKSCTKLGIPASNVTVIDDERLQDGPNAVWDAEVIGACVTAVYLRVGAHCVVTFDSGGGSGHQNHTSLYAAVQKLYRSGKLANTPVYTLETTGVIRKYLSVLDIPVSSLLSPPAFVSSPRQIALAWQAMAAHKTQLVWFRKLYIVFSRYMFVNTLQQMS